MEQYFMGEYMLGLKGTSKEVHAYSSSLKVKRCVTIKKSRRLPISGEVFVKEGERVEHGTIVARTDIGSYPRILPISRMIGVKPENLHRYMLKQVGDTVEEGELLALYSAFFRIIYRSVESPIKGTVGLISDITGQVVLNREPIPVEVEAYIPGKVVEVLPREGAVIETNAALIQGIFGIGGESHGRLRIAVESPDEVLTADMIRSDDQGVIIVGGSMVTADALQKGVGAGVSCIVVGGVRHEDLTTFMGEEFGVAITGQEDLGVTLILTEGFGRMSMSQITFDLLKEFEGYRASVNGSTQIRAGVLRPEIIIPHEEAETLNIDELPAVGLVLGTLVRIIRQPFFGAFGEVIRLPIKLHQVESESRVRVLDVKLTDGSIVTVPRANVEIIAV